MHMPRQIYTELPKIELFQSQAYIHTTIHEKYTNLLQQGGFPKKKSFFRLFTRRWVGCILPVPR